MLWANGREMLFEGFRLQVYLINRPVPYRGIQIIRNPLTLRAFHIDHRDVLIAEFREQWTIGLNCQEQHVRSVRGRYTPVEVQNGKVSTPFPASKNQVAERKRGESQHRTGHDGEQKPFPDSGVSFWKFKEITGTVHLTEGHCVAMPSCPMRHGETLPPPHTIASITSQVV